MFCEVYGDTLRNKALEFWLIADALDFPASAMAEDISVSRPKAYQILSEFEKEKIIRRSRIVGRTQLYKLNKANPLVKIFLRNFDECIQMVVDEHQEEGINNVRIN
jgi:predicted transcriptional regulator